MRRAILFFLLMVLMAGCESARTDRPNSGSLKAESPSSPVRVYVTNERSGTVSVIDPASNQIVTTIPVGKRPRGIHLSPDGLTVYLALSGSPIAGPFVKDEDLPPADKAADGIGIIDARTGRFKGKIASGSDPEQFSLGADGRYLYVSNEDVAKASVVDLASQTVIKSIDVALEPEGVTTSPDGRLVYVTCEGTNEVHVIDTASHTVTAIIKTPARPRSVAFLPDGSKAFVTCENAAAVAVVDVASNEVSKSIHIEGELARPMGIVLSPDASRAYVTMGRGKTVAVIDTASDKVLKIIPNVGERPWGIGITPDGKTLYTANGPSNDVTVIDVATLSVKSRIPAGNSPWGVAVSGHTTGD